MFAYIVMACHISLMSTNLTCDWIVNKTFETETACEEYKAGYTLKSGEQFGTCDELKEGLKAGDKTPILYLKK